MSDYIKREDAKQLFMNHMGNHFPQSFKEQIAEKAFEELSSSADVVEVVRCKDCKYWLPHTQCGFDEDNDEYHNYCNYHMPDDEWYAGYWEADDYCSYGERKDE